MILYRDMVGEKESNQLPIRIKLIINNNMQIKKCQEKTLHTQGYSVFNIFDEYFQ